MVIKPNTKHLTLGLSIVLLSSCSSTTPVVKTIEKTTPEIVKTPAKVVKTPIKKAPVPAVRYYSNPPQITTQTARRPKAPPKKVALPRALPRALPKPVSRAVVRSRPVVRPVARRPRSKPRPVVRRPIVRRPAARRPVTRRPTIARRAPVRRAPVRRPTVVRRAPARRAQPKYQKPRPRPPYRHQVNPFPMKLAYAALNRTRHNVRYDGRYLKIGYPWGDVPRGIGVCTDVIIRSYRKLGVDLQQQVHRDMNSNFSAYPNLRKWNLKRPDSNIDHRRVYNLRIFLARHAQTLPRTTNPAHYQPGDLITWQLGPGQGHIGVVSNQRSKTDPRRYMIVHNIAEGPKLEDVLFSYPMSGHYRYNGQMKYYKSHPLPEVLPLPLARHTKKKINLLNVRLAPLPSPRKKARKVSLLDIRPDQLPLPPKSNRKIGLLDISPSLLR
ncbi:MAG: DUF1287 domain-containing protein [Thiotrichaceae bacterium]|nr:DUF1287 domain-containing protein [Thiotrichaceae bacterium]